MGTLGYKCSIYIQRFFDFFVWLKAWAELLRFGDRLFYTVNLFFVFCDDLNINISYIDIYLYLGLVEFHVVPWILSQMEYSRPRLAPHLHLPGAE